MDTLFSTGALLAVLYNTRERFLKIHDASLLPNINTSTLKHTVVSWFYGQTPTSCCIMITCCHLTSFIKQALSSNKKMPREEFWIWHGTLKNFVIASSSWPVQNNLFVYMYLNNLSLWNVLPGSVPAEWVFVWTTPNLFASVVCVKNEQRPCIRHCMFQNQYFMLCVFLLAFVSVFVRWKLFTQRFCHWVCESVCTTHNFH